MKISCLPVSFFSEIISGKMSLKDWAGIARKAGLDGMDISPLFIKAHTPVYLKEIKKEIDSESMNVIMMTAYPDFSHPDKIERERQLEYLGTDIAVASYLGAKYVRVTAGQAHPQTPIADGIKWVVEGFSRAAEKAERLGVRLVYENHSKPGAWDYVDFSHPTDIFLEIVEGTKNVPLGINFDTANIIVYGDDTIDVLRKVINRVETIHANDTTTKGKLTPTLLGEGIVPFDEILDELKKVNFDGWICIEECSGRGEEGVNRAVKFIKNKL